MATTPQRRVSPVYIALGAVVVLAILFLLLQNVFLGGDEELPPLPTTPPQAIQPPAEPTPPPEEMEVFEIFEGRDPFRPLIVEAPATPPDGAPPDGAPPPDGTAPVDGAPPPTEPREPVSTAPPREGVQVEVLSVAEDSSSATVRVGSTVHEDARPGDTLSSGVVVESISGGCASFRRDGRSFRLCEGESVRK